MFSLSFCHAERSEASRLANRFFPAFVNVNHTDFHPSADGQNDKYECYFTGNTFAETSPKPIRTPFFSANPRIITVS